LAFTIAANGPTLLQLIWAIATTRPSSDAVDAQLTQHIASGAIQLDLSRTFTDNTMGTAVPTGPPGDNPYLPPFPTQTSGVHGFELPALLPYQKMLQAHAILCGVGFLVVLPTGALLARWGRTFTNSWFKFHWIVQAVIGIPIIASGWSLAVAGVITKQGTHFDDTHKIIGLSLLGAYILQLMLGIHIHFFKPKGGIRPKPMPAGGKAPNVVHSLAASNRPFLNYVHPFWGISIIAVAFYQVSICRRQVILRECNPCNRSTLESMSSGECRQVVGQRPPPPKKPGMPGLW
jgi:Eukaryotic cytochrome b561